MANLSPGPLLKSQQHADALQHHLRASGNTHEGSHAPANPTAVIRRSHGPDELLRGVPKRKPVAQGMRRVRDETEDDALARMSDAREQRADNAGRSMSKAQGSAFGAFQVMKDRVQKGFGSFMKALVSDEEARARTLSVLNSLYCSNPAALAKSVGTEHGESFESRYGTSGLTAAQAVGVKAAPAAAKPTLAKSIAKPSTKPVTMATVKARLLGLARAVGNEELVKSLEAGYGSNSATLTGGSAMRKQSLSKRVASTTIGGDPKPRYSPEDLLKGAAAALHAGAITGAEAQAIQHHVNMTGDCPDHLLKKLTGETTATPTRLLTRSEVEAACAKGMQSGAISGAEGIHVSTCLSLGHAIDGGVMQRLKSIHHSK
ncbi:hypothetical protein [Paraburkholderia bryophila]|uniref:Uncharacterized protein n=1 Tax=Paraburkholderia bryophila TaxID=420952 RepID=A0A7Y9WQF2_9BURK|nr:hypothetical protein [Paraburkholderia bryophila]NYH24688.1 hypothetical protein [Paraburkholderia bryophila]